MVAIHLYKLNSHHITDASEPSFILLFILYRRQLIIGTMPSIYVVEHFDMLEKAFNGSIVDN